MATDTISQSINTKKVTGRREVHYETFDDVIRDAESLAASGHRALGNWSLGQNLMHLAAACHGMIDGLNFKLPAPMRFLFSALMKKRFLTKPLPPGFKAPNDQGLQPGPTSPEEGLAALREAVERVKKDKKRCMHPALGNISSDEWDQFQLRHCELHMSFIVPE